jgi:hypothetical protein
MRNSKEKRQHIRYSLIGEQVKWMPKDNIHGPEMVEIHDISDRGVFIESISPVKPQSTIFIEFKLPGDLGSLTVEGRVTWKRWAQRKEDEGKLGFGVEFVNMPSNIDSILKAYVVYLRNRQIITVSKRLMQDFFGDKSKPILL